MYIFAIKHFAKRDKTAIAHFIIKAENFVEHALQGHRFVMLLFNMQLANIPHQNVAEALTRFLGRAGF